MGRLYYPKDILKGDIYFQVGDQVMIPFCEKGLPTLVPAMIKSDPEFFDKNELYLSFDDDFKKDTQIHRKLFSCRGLKPDGKLLSVCTSEGNIIGECRYPTPNSSKMLALLRLLMSRCTIFNHCCLNDKRLITSIDEHTITTHMNTDLSDYHSWYYSNDNKPVVNILSLFGYGKYQTPKYRLYKLISSIHKKTSFTYEQTSNVDLVRMKYESLIPGLVVESMGNLSINELDHMSEIIPLDPKNKIPCNHFDNWWAPSAAALFDNHLESDMLETTQGPTDELSLTTTLKSETPKPKEKCMSITPTIIKSNKDAAFLAAQIEAGRLATTIITKMVTPQLPMMFQGYAQHPLAALGLANLVTFGVEQFRPDDENAQFIAEAMRIAAYTELLKSFNLESMLDKVLMELNGKIKFPTMTKPPKSEKLPK